MDLFGFRSKKTSEAGVWIPDEDVTDCPLCGKAFNLIVRKHHCRACGQIVCGKCSENRKFLESSRTGTPKRVCDGCWAKDGGAGPAYEDDEEEDDADVRKASKAMAKASVSGGGGASGGGSAAAGGSGAAAAPAPAPPKKAPAVKLPQISPEEAVQALKDYPFDGRWKFTMSFLTVELGPPGARDPAASMSSFKSAGAAGKKSTLNKDGTVRAGSNVDVIVHLKPKGTAYFQGEVPEFGQFGQNGKVTGALQRSNGKVSMTIQMVNKAAITTSFNLTGFVNKSGVFCGTFSGCEISKSAGSVGGAFRAVREEKEGGEDGAGDVGADSDDSGSDGDSPAPPPKPAGPRPGAKAAAAKKSAATADSDSD